jgi:amidophosphoribosyltransferase
MPTRQELIASSHSIEEIRRYITSDSLGYLSLEGMLSVVQENRQNFCTACFSGEYPIQFPGMNERLELPLFERMR